MSSDHIDALKELRSISVDVRRRRVAEFLQSEAGCADENGLVQIQNAIAAIDAAIADEYRLLQVREPIPARRGGTLPAKPDEISLKGHIVVAETVGSGDKRGMNGSSHHGAIASSNGWRSYRDWIASDRTRLAS